MNHRSTALVLADYVNLARAIGAGFHPDTSGDDYTSLPDGITAADVDRIVDAAYDHDIDVHAIALDLLEELVAAGDADAIALGVVAVADTIAQHMGGAR